MTIGETKRDEEPQQSERTSGISEVVGGTPEKQKQILERFKDIFENYASNKTLIYAPLEKFEREKSPEEKALLDEILRDMKDFVEKYEGVPVPLKSEHIHILDKEKIIKEFGIEIGTASYSHHEQTVEISDEGSPLVNAQKLIHELMHLNSFQSLNGAKENEKYPGSSHLEYRTYIRRQGWGVFVEGKRLSSREPREERFFENIDEAVTEELAQRFIRTYFHTIPVLFAEIDNGGALDINSRSEERKEFNKLMEDIFLKNRDKFNSTEDIFNLFARAHMAGRLLPVARLIEETYGKGAFRKLGNKTKRVLRS